MNDGVKILLARMKTHPEEFIYNPHEDANKWSVLLNSFRHCFTKEEINALDEGVRNIERDRFTQLVMTELLDPHEDAQQELDLVRRYQQAKTTAASNTPQILPGSITYTSEPLVNKKPTTTRFGRLYNHEHNND
jgi:hypothetical protein